MTKLDKEIQEGLYDPKKAGKGKGKLTISGKKPALQRLKKHLEKEHPSTKGKMKVNDPVPKRCVPGICKALEAKGLECDTHDIAAEIDSTVSCDQNKREILAKFGARKTDKYAEYARHAKQHYSGQGKLAVARPDVRAAAFARMREAGELRGYDANHIVPDTKKIRQEHLAIAKYRLAGGLRGDGTKLSVGEKERLKADIKRLSQTVQQSFEKEQKAKAQQGKKLRGQQTLTSAVSTSRRLSEFGFDPKVVKVGQPYISSSPDFWVDTKTMKHGHLIETLANRARKKKKTQADYTVMARIGRELITRAVTGKPTVAEPLKYDIKKPSGWFDAMVRGIKRSSDVRNPWAIVKRIWEGLSPEKKKDILRREAAGERFNYDLPLPDDRDTKGTGTLRMVKPFKLAEAQVNVSAKDMQAVKKSGIFKPMKREDGTTCMVARCKSKTPVNIFVDVVR